MKNEKQVAKELFQAYHKQYHSLVNIYCQAKMRNPFNEYPDLAKAIYRVGVLLELWHDVAVTREEQRYFEGG